MSDSTAGTADRAKGKQEDEPLAERVLGPEAYFFDSKRNLFLAALVPLVAFLFLPRILWMVRSHTLPDIFVRPSTPDSILRAGLPPQTRLECRNLNVAQPDLWNRTKDHHDRPMQALAYCEDAKLLTERGVAIIACDPGRHRWNTVMGLLQDPDPRGALWVWDYIEGTQNPNLINIKGLPAGIEFHPLGMHVHEKADGEYTLYVVNHRKLFTTVESFDLKAGKRDIGWTAQFTRSFTHPLVTHSANAVALLDEKTLLISNDHLFPSRPPPRTHLVFLFSHVFGSFLGPHVASVVSVPIVSTVLSYLETLLGIPTSFVSVVDLSAPHTSGKIVARGIGFANGIAVSPGGKTIAVAETGSPSIRLYSPVRDSATGKLEELKLVDKAHTPMVIDNLDFTQPLWTRARSAGGDQDLFEGAKLIASGHPHPLKLLSFARDPTNLDKQSGTWSISMEPAAPPPPERKMDLANWRAFQDGVKVPAAKRTMTQSSRWLFKTLYQAQKGFVKANGFGVATGATALWDPSTKGKGTLIVTGLYARGVLVCSAVGME
ncbi:hypothetical protein K437DRAFT_259176 [Tilletiaria anomala UBC 951]|uniref:Calcium-dependent phosphotriesterase n=1 Tax=Tilletiaria anomala (strain ATCC 24038 / CBS 436.72 / UBC 951) TaxID=1037660 RepID=A0A066VK80_TILAU|nr:uncharacterized protein K437DRAFT_259176 [Tilletiaria anomala UBC 951]KDN39169.1 hypothetical protein K437DRAFT_259176 [Tilletiaria anomala UBC 951]